MTGKEGCVTIRLPLYIHIFLFRQLSGKLTALDTFNAAYIMVVATELHLMHLTQELQLR